MQILANGWCKRTESEWQQILAKWSRSGQTGRDFCRGEGIRLSSFQRWQHRLAAAAPANDFVTVTAAGPSSPAWTVEVTLPNGVTLRFQG